MFHQKKRSLDIQQQLKTQLKVVATHLLELAYQNQRQ